MKKRYRSKGFVWGNFWDGGQGGFQAEPLEATTKAKLLSKAEKGVEEGWLDSGMGYESVIGALLEVEEISTIQEKGKEFSRSEYSIEIVGELPGQAEEVLLEAL